MSGRIGASVSGVPLVLEEEFEFKPGSFEVVAVAEHVSSGEVISVREEGVWPFANGEGVWISPVAVVQERVGLFWRGGEVRRRGTVAFTGEEAVLSGQAVGLMAVVCGEGGRRGEVEVSRELLGETVLGMGSQRLGVGGEEGGCGVFRDLVAGGSMRSGEFTYRIRVVRGGREVGSAERRFRVVEGEGSPASEPREPG